MLGLTLLHITKIQLFITPALFFLKKKNEKTGAIGVSALPSGVCYDCVAMQICICGALLSCRSIRTACRHQKRPAGQNQTLCATYHYHYRRKP